MDFDYKILYFEKTNQKFTPKEIEYLKLKKEMSDDDYLEQTMLIWDETKNFTILQEEYFVIEIFVENKKITLALTVNELSFYISIRRPFNGEEKILCLLKNEAFASNLYHHIRTQSKDRLRFQVLFGPLRDTNNLYFKE